MVAPPSMYKLGAPLAANRATIWGGSPGHLFHSAALYHRQIERAVAQHYDALGTIGPRRPKSQDGFESVATDDNGIHAGHKFVIAVRFAAAHRQKVEGAVPPRNETIEAGADKDRYHGHAIPVLKGPEGDAGGHFTSWMFVVHDPRHRFQRRGRLFSEEAAQRARAWRATPAIRPLTTTSGPTASNPRVNTVKKRAGTWLPDHSGFEDRQQQCEAEAEDGECRCGDPTSPEQSV